MGSLLNQAGYQPVEDPHKANVLIVNTCGFIGPARDESYQVLAIWPARNATASFWWPPAA